MSHCRPKLSFRYLGACAFSLALCACQKEEIRAYRVARETQAHPHAPAPAAPAEKIAWQLPPGWEERPSSGMRLANFVAPGPEGQSADISILSLPGVMARDLEFLNLWREQLHLPPVDADQMQRDLELVNIGGSEGKLADLVGEKSAGDQPPPPRLVIAMLSRTNAMWFFKMTGDSTWLNQQKPVFKEFLKSITFPAESTGLGAPPALAGEPATRARSTNAEPRPEWQIPASWKEQPPSAMRFASFLAGPAAGPPADVSVTVFPGAAGGILGNVNRWRDQIGLPPLAAQDLPANTTALDPGQPNAILVDMTGKDARTQQPSRVLAAVVPRSNQTWFYKMSGPPAVVEQEKASFVKFLQSVRYAQTL